VKAPRWTRWAVYTMMMAFALMLIFSVTGCTGFQYASFHPDGTPKMVAQTDATLAKGEASAREITLPNGVAFRSVQQNYDGTTVATGLIDGKVTLGLGKLLKEERINADNNATAVAIDKNKPNVIKATAEGEATVINAEAAAAEAVAE
jgi:hypothetical protein